MADVQFLLPVPSDPPDTGVFFFPAFGEQWIPVIVGKLRELQDPGLWDTPPDDLLEQIDDLIYRLTVDNSERLPRVIGEVAMFGFSPPPDGWLVCEGQAVSRTTYADLFDAIGTTFGVGNGSTTFNVPNFIRRSPYGTNPDGEFLGDKEGSEIHTLTVAELPAHTHPPLSPANDFMGRRTSGGSVNWATTAGNTGTAVSTTGSTGSGNAHTILHPVISLVFGIYTGVYS